MNKQALCVTLAICAVIVLAVSRPGRAGDLNPPPGPVAPTMKTLTEIEPRIPISSVPYAISESGSYYFTGDLQVSPAAPADGITVQADDVTIDLMGYSLFGPGAASGMNQGIYMENRNNVEIRNGTVRDFGGWGIFAFMGGKTQRVVNVRAVSNGMTGIFLQGVASLVQSCTVEGNGSLGIFTMGAGSIVINNSACNNAAGGMNVGKSSTVTGNTAFNNGGYGIGAGDGSTVTGNTAYYNQESGISASPCCLITGNTVRWNNLSNDSNSAGIGAGGGCVVKGNLATDNLRNNIYISSLQSVVEENIVIGSGTGYGIYFLNAGNFYANNRATGHTTNYGGSVPTGSGDGGGNVQF